MKTTLKLLSLLLLSLLFSMCSPDNPDDIKNVTFNTSVIQSADKISTTVQDSSLFIVTTEARDYVFFKTSEHKYELTKSYYKDNNTGTLKLIIFSFMIGFAISALISSIINQR